MENNQTPDSFFSASKENDEIDLGKIFRFLLMQSSKQDYYTLYKVKVHTLSSHLPTKRSLMLELALMTLQVKKVQLH